MSPIADFTTSIPEENRLFLLRGQLAQMYKAGQGGRMGRLVIDPAWIKAQRGFDPSLQTYLQGVELAMRAIEEGQAGERGLLLLMVLSLLHSNARSITATLPDEALQLMSQDGRVEQARSLALQRPNPLERGQALLTIAEIESGLGNRNSAAETLNLARQEMQKIASPESHCRSMLSLLAAEQSLNPNYEHMAKQLGLLCDLAKTISFWQTRAIVMAEIADAGTTAGVASGRPVYQDFGLTEIFDRCAREIKNTYMAEKAATERQREENNRKIDRNAPFSYKLFRDSPKLHATIQIIDDLKLWDQPVYLVYAAYADQEPKREDPSSWTHKRFSPTIVAMLLRTAGNLGDQATGKRIGDLLLSCSCLEPRSKYENIYGWDSEKIIEAAAEAGFADLALNLIAHKLIDTADVSKLKEAMARGAGRRGDIENIERAAGPIKAAGRPGTLRDRIDRTLEGAGDGLAKSAISWLVAKGVSRAEFERIAVYSEGYDGLKERDPKQAEVFLGSVCRRLGPAGEKLLRQILTVGIEGIENQAMAWAEKLASAADHLPWTDNDDLASDRVDYWLLRADFDRALKVAAAVKTPVIRSQLSRMIASEMIKAGQLERAMSLAATITERIEQRSLYQEAMAYLTTGASQGENGWTDRITAELGRLKDEDRLAKSPAFPALVASLSMHEPPSRVLDLLEPSGAGALQAACGPLAYGIARVKSAQQAVEAADKLLARLEKQDSSMPRIRAACALVRAWEGAGHLSAAAQRAYALALKDARFYKFITPIPFTSSFFSTPKRPKETGILTELASAARALNDRKALLDLWEQANKILTGKRGAEDLALIDICAGLARLGETWRKEHISDFPPFKAIDWNHQPFAYLEVARAEASLLPDVVYKARKRNVLSAAADWGSEKLDKMAESDPAKKKEVAWKNYRDDWAEKQLAFQREGFVDRVIRDLPEMPPPGATIQTRLEKKGKPPGKTTQAVIDESGKGTGIFFNLSKSLAAGADYWLHMIQALADVNAHDAIPRAVLGAQHCLETSKEKQGDLLSTNQDPPITPEEMETIVDTAMTSLLECGRVDLARQLAQVFPDRQAGVEARLAAVSNDPRQAEQTLVSCLEHRWSQTNIKAIASSAACLPGLPERWAIAIKILHKARLGGRAQVLEALGALVPLASTILAPEDLCSAVRRIIASESDW